MPVCTRASHTGAVLKKRYGEKHFITDKVFSRFHTIIIFMQYRMRMILLFCGQEGVYRQTDKTNQQTDYCNPPVHVPRVVVLLYIICIVVRVCAVYCTPST